MLSALCYQIYIYIVCPRSSDPFYIVTDYIKWVKLAYKLVRSFDLWSFSFFRSVSELELSDLSRTCITIWNQKLASLKIKSVDPDPVLVISRRRIHRKSFGLHFFHQFLKLKETCLLIPCNIQYIIAKVSDKRKQTLKCFHLNKVYGHNLLTPWYLLYVQEVLTHFILYWCYAKWAKISWTYSNKIKSRM